MSKPPALPTLSPFAHLAVVGRDVVLLDTRSDAYFCIPDGVAYLRPMADGSRLQPTEEAATALVAAGLISDTEPDAVPIRTRPQRPIRSLCPNTAVKVAVGDLCRLILALGDLWLRYPGRGLGQIVAFASASQPGAGPADAQEPEAERLARVFHRLAPWLPISSKCLVRSFVLLRFLQRSGVRGQWVFGVTTWPFSAHCWIQTGDRALDDHWERLLVYEPIMVVR